MAIRAFISYSHKDAELLTQLHSHLSALRRQGLLDAWTDRQILPGAHIDNEVKEQLETAQLYLLLISAAFIESSYCFEKEFAHACERCASGKALIVPIIVRECDWKIPALCQFKALPEDGKAVTSRHWHSLDEGFANVAVGLRTLIEAGPFTKQKVVKERKRAEKFIPDERHITEEERDELKKIAEEIVIRLTARSATQPVEILRQKQGRCFGIVWSQFNEYFGIETLAALPREKLGEGKSWLQQYRASKDKNLKRADPQRFRNSLFRGIFGYLKALQWTKDQLYAFAAQQMASRPIQSLEELGNNQLEIVRNKLRYEITKQKAKLGQNRNRRRSGQDPEASVNNDLSLCPTNVLVKWVEELAAAGRLTESSPALLEVQVRASYVKCPKEDLAAFQILDKTALIPLFGWTKLPPEIIHIPGARYPPPPPYYQKQHL
jgi:hypothetical protein